MRLLLASLEINVPNGLTVKDGGSWLWREFIAHGVPLLVVLGAAWLVLRGATLVAHRIVDHAKKHGGDADESVRRAETLSMVLGYTTRIFVVGFVVLAVLHEFGADVTPFLTGAGIVGIVVGLGAQSVVKDIVTGVFIFTEEQFSIGDVVELGGKSGVVEAINLRTTILRAVDGSVHIIPNGQITVATNMSYRWSRAVVDLSVGYDQDFDKVIAVLKRVAAEAKADPAFAKDLLEEPQVIGPEAFNEHSMKVQVLAKTPPLRQWEVGRQLRRRIKSAFDAAGITVPVPQRMIHVKSGEAISPPNGTR